MIKLTDKSLDTVTGQAGIDLVGLLNLPVDGINDFEDLDNAVQDYFTTVSMTDPVGSMKNFMQILGAIEGDITFTEEQTQQLFQGMIDGGFNAMSREFQKFGIGTLHFSQVTVNTHGMIRLQVK